MDLRSIRYFVEIAAIGSITRAADKLRVAQSALSRHMRILEEELGVQLLIREARGVRATEAGLQFLDHCQRAMRELALARDELRAHKEAPSGNVVLGITPTIGPLLLPGLIEHMEQQCPAVRLRIVEGHSPALADSLLLGDIDVAVLMNPPAGRTLAVRPLVSEPIVVMMPAERRKAGNLFTLAELARTPLILTTASRELLENRLRRIGAKPIVKIEVGAIETIRRLLMRGIGATVLPISTFREDTLAGRIAAFPIADKSFQRTLYLAYPGEHRSRAALAAISTILAAETSALAELGMFDPSFDQKRQQNARSSVSPRL
jgi:LysR family nitrogen assimilation transcriptional regulator